MRYDMQDLRPHLIWMQPLHIAREGDAGVVDEGMDPTALLTSIYCGFHQLA